MAMFNFPDQKLETLSGGIVKFEKEELTQGKGGTKVYLWVDNIEAMVEASFPSLLSAGCIF